MTRIDVINQLAVALGARTYLEIGVQRGTCLGMVRVAEKTGVDPDPKSAATIHATSDAYFSTLSPDARFDLIFIDGLHEAGQVGRDIDNALRHLSPGGAVVVHDCDPPSEAAGRPKPCPGTWCGDVWRGWLAARLRVASHLLAVVNVDLGCGVMLPGQPEIPGYNPDLPAEIAWKEFQAKREELLNLVSPTVFSLLVAELPPIRARQNLAP